MRDLRESFDSIVCARIVVVDNVLFARGVNSQRDALQIMNFSQEV